MASLSTAATPASPGRAGGVSLLEACAKGNAEDLQTYLAAGGDAAYANSHGITAAIALSFPPTASAKPAMLRALVAAGASAKCTATFGKNTPNITALHLAAGNGDAALVGSLIDDGGADANAADDAGQTPLFLAAMNRHEAAVAALLSRGADAAAATRAGADALTVLAEPPPAEEEEGTTADGAVARIAASLAAAGARLDRRDCHGMTSLHAGALHGNSALVGALLAAGAAPDARMDDEDAWTPLMLAVHASEAPFQRKVEVVRALAAGGASLSHTLKDTSGRDAYDLCSSLDLRLVLTTLGEDRSDDSDGEGLDDEGLPEDALERALTELCLTRTEENRRRGREESEDEVFAACVQSAEFRALMEGRGVPVRADHDDFNEGYVAAQEKARNALTESER